ncbi:MULTISPECIES: tetratricopeptide repeat protein [unclassified Streptomyces]|uniref:tetratricopeptide repeat protein n=1 Tax=unclassified Streptomyces TaxID=2593676 RepID=UPI001489FC9E|nr:MULTISPECIES: tetratricopeptide repeat protein [unclassified Streptomyces]
MSLDSAHVLGPALYHPNTVENTACLAESIGKQQRWEEAEALARPNLATSERALGRVHPRTLVSLITLAWVLFRRGSTAEAEQLAQSVTEGNEQQLGPCLDGEGAARTMNHQPHPPG